MESNVNSNNTDETNTNLSIISDPNAKKTPSTEEARIGVYMCKCGQNIGGVVNVNKVVEELKQNPEVVIARGYEHFCSDSGQNMIKQDIEKLGLTRVVIAACSPRMHEPTFRKTLQSAGLNPYLLEIANIREHCSWVHAHEPELATEKAKNLVEMAISKVKYSMPLETHSIKVEKTCLVIGGGIAGIQSALDIADAGFKVYMVEKSPSIGGKMAQWGKVFPSMDCSQCILTPKMSDVKNHANINLYVNSDVIEVMGSVGNFTVKIRKNPSYVNEKCTACGSCAQKCPWKKIPNEFNCGLDTRTAIYKPFAQAVPNKYTIDPVNCVMITKGKCGACQKVCQAGAIDYTMKPETFSIHVGTIIVATGFDTFNPEQIPRYGYGIYPNIITGPMFERMISPFGPSEGNLYRISDHKKPKSIAFLLCVGSRDETLGVSYCSRVCCMYTCKHAQLVKNYDPSIDVSIFFMDIRCFGKGYEEFYQATQSMGVNFIRAKVAEIHQDFNSKNLVLRYEDTLLGRTMLTEYDMVVLAVGQKPHSSTEELAKVLNIPKGLDGFFLEAHPKLRPNDTPVDGIFLAGSCQYPKDIADAVAQASGAASRAMIPLCRGEVTTEPLIARPKPQLCSGCKVCQSICAYQAIEVKPVDGFRNVAVVNEALCRGCGACASACPKRAIEAPGFTDQQIISQVETCLHQLSEGS